MGASWQGDRMKRRTACQSVPRDRAPRIGFTLIELLVVIAVVAVLMAIFLPSLQRTRSQGRAVVCGCNLRQWGTMFSTYMTEHDGKCWNGVWLASQGSWLSWVESTRAYCRGEDAVRLCPTAKKLPDPPDASLDWYTQGGKLYAWGWVLHGGLPEQWLAYGSYGHNYAVIDTTSVADDPGKGKAAASLWIPPGTRGSSKVPILFDCARPDTSLGDRWEPPASDAPPKFSDTYDVNERTPPISRYVCVNRHDGGINCLFLDWSQRKVGLKELWTLKWTKNFNTAGPWTKAGGVQPESWPAWLRRFKEY
jgi:prepilin-type N-terminal cleavage/methylation domain-containing protein/prepilin-type processing-associated H-X9-DG protein